MSAFRTTRWSLIAAARDSPSRAQAALDQLCQAYRPPVLAFIRHSGYGNDAEDLTQAFFLRFIERGWYAEADPQRGSFRALMLTALRRFLSDQYERAGALKRGGRTVESGSLLEVIASDGQSPEDAFMRAWMGTVLEHAMQRLEEEWSSAGKLDQFRQLAPLLLERAEGDELRAIAVANGLRTNTLAVQTHRMRQRLRQLVRLELLQTVGSPEALERELAELRGALDEMT
jgi:RNA polymerase sigma factor (sigma-70 family)